MKVKISKKDIAANDICLLELVRQNGGSLPGFTAGAHIDVHLGTDLVRQYSLCNDPLEQDRYVIAVLREANSRGGSLAVHTLEEGDEIEIGEPRNQFPLHPDAAHSILIAGGIGITPILSMAEFLGRTGKSYELHYCCRSKDRAAFVDRLNEFPFREHSALYFDEVGPRIALAQILAEPVSGKHVYVCGPSGFIEAVLGSAHVLGWQDANLHREFFAAPPSSGSGADRSFKVRITSTGALIDVAAGETIVQSLRRCGIRLVTQCEQGVCGTCETKVLDGIPDHRDLYLSVEEQASGNVMMPCCSRSLTPILTLDL